MVIPSSYLSTLSSLSSRRLLVTGGAGFLGRHIVELLRAVGCEVTVFDIVQPREPVQGVKYIAGDLISFDQVSAAVAGHYCVIHVASPSPTCNDPKLFERVNVTGTANLIASCRAANCNRIVFTSSASVVFDGSDQENFDEKSPKPESSMDAYTKTKLAAERLILSASDESFFTCALRPHGIFGPRDPHMVPAMARVGRSNKSRYQIGSGTNLVDFTYVENVAFAHLLAAARLNRGERICGQEYFITNKQPILFWEFFAIHFRNLGYVEPYLSMPVKMMRPMARLTELVTPIIQRASRDFKPTFTLQAINYAGVHHYYNCSKAESDFGYFPAITMNEGITRTLNHFQELKNPNPIQIKPKIYTRGGSNFFNLATFVLTALAIFLILTANSLGNLLSISTANQRFFDCFIYLFALKLFHSAFRSTSFGEKLVEFNENVDLTGKTVVITGANKGIGFASAIKFARLNARVVIACRNSQLGNDAADKIRSLSGSTLVSVRQLDLNSLASIAGFVDELASSKQQRIDILINNAGAMMDFSVNSDSNESQFQTNFLGHYYLTRLLFERNLFAAAARIVNVSSVMHYRGLLDFTDLQGMRGKHNKLAAYENSKLAQIVFTKASQRLFDRVAHETQQPRITVLAVNPGAVASEFIDHFIPRWLRIAVVPLLNLFLTKDIHSAAHTIVHAGCSQKLRNVGGYYFDNCKLAIPHPQALDEKIQNQLWAECAKLCKLAEIKI